MNNDTPKTNTAAYNGHSELLRCAKQMERDLEAMRAALEAVANAATLDVAKWEANTALATTTAIEGLVEERPAG